MKKILLITTGGTIASTPSENGLVPTAAGGEMLRLIPELEGLCEVRCTALFNADSSCLQPEDWVAMAKAAFAALPDFDGVVLTHGTDTMAYTAAALSFMLQNLDKAVVLTGSQLPLEHPDSDGRRNLLDAFRVAADGRLKGVFVVFAGRVIPGYCVRKVYARSFATMEAINHPLAGEIVDGELVLRGAPKEPQGPPALLAVAEARVLLVKLVPGTPPELLDAAAALGCRAVVIEAFGLGGVPNLRRSLLPAIERLIHSGVAVVVTTQCVYEGSDLGVYGVGVKAGRTGVLSGGVMTPEAIVAKLMWILGQTQEPERVRELFRRDCLGELSPG